jgi:hypothetical protein
MEDVRGGDRSDYAAALARDAARADRRRVACFLVIIARHAKGAGDFAELAGAVMPDGMDRSGLLKFYDRALEMDSEEEQERLAGPREAMLAVWEQVKPPSRWSDEKRYMPGLQAAAMAFARAGGQLSVNTLLELVPARRADMAGRAIQRLRGQLTAVGEEPSEMPSRKGGLVKVYVLR